MDGHALDVCFCKSTEKKDRGFSDGLSLLAYANEDARASSELEPDSPMCTRNMTSSNERKRTGDAACGVSRQSGEESANMEEKDEAQSNYDGQICETEEPLPLVCTGRHEHSVCWKVMRPLLLGIEVGIDHGDRAAFARCSPGDILTVPCPLPLISASPRTDITEDRRDSERNSAGGSWVAWHALSPGMVRPFGTTRQRVVQRGMVFIEDDL